MSVGPAARVGCIFPKSPLGKTRPRINPQNGTYFPAEAARGNHVPESSLKPGRAFPFKLVWESASQNSAPKWDTVFPKGPPGETASHFSAPEWDAVSGSALKRKLHPRFSLQTGVSFPSGTSAGNCVPELSFRVGPIFR